MTHAAQIERQLEAVQRDCLSAWSRIEANEAERRQLVDDHLADVRRDIAMLDRFIAELNA